MTFLHHHLLRSVAWKQINHVDWFTERRATRSAETGRCIITSSGRRWWVSKAVSCHRNPWHSPTKTAQKVEQCYFNSAPFCLRHPTHTALWNRRCVALGRRWTVMSDWVVLTCSSVPLHVKRKCFYQEWLKGNFPGYIIIHKDFLWCRHSFHPVLYFSVCIFYLFDAIYSLSPC